MIIGACLGVLYSIWGFGAQGEPPRLAINAGPFEDGMLFVSGCHVHHWMVYAPLACAAAWCRWYELMGFSVVMSIHGLSYGDAFRVRGKREKLACVERVDITNRPF